MHQLFFLSLSLIGLLAFGGPAWAGEAKVVRVGYQKSGALVLAKNEGALEKALQPLGYTVEWKEFTSGPPLIEALNGGSIDFGHSGDAPLIFAQAAGVPFQYLANTPQSPNSSAILVPKDSPLRTIGDLKGRKVAFTKGTSAHHLVFQALISAKLTLADIKPVYLSPPDARGAFQSGRVDAWAIWDPFFAAAEVDAEARVLVSSGAFSPNREFYFGRAEFLASHPETIAPFLTALQETGLHALKEPKATAEFLSAKLGISQAVIERSESRKNRYTLTKITPEVVAEQQAFADAFLAQGLLPKAIVVAHAVYAPGQIHASASH